MRWINVLKASPRQKADMLKPVFQPPDLNRGRVIVVEDDPAVVRSLKFALELEGYEVLSFPDAERLLSVDLPPGRACLVVDVRLPRLDGIEAVRVLRERGVELPTVIMPTAPTADMRRRAASVHAPIVEKPLLGDELMRAIHNALPPLH